MHLRNIAFSAEHRLPYSLYRCHAICSRRPVQATRAPSRVRRRHGSLRQSAQSRDLVFQHLHQHGGANDGGRPSLSKERSMSSQNSSVSSSERPSSMLYSICCTPARLARSRSTFSFSTLSTSRRRRTCPCRYTKVRGAEGHSAPHGRQPAGPCRRGPESGTVGTAPSCARRSCVCK